jgi:hypothetical protein
MDISFAGRSQPGGSSPFHIHAALAVIVAIALWPIANFAVGLRRLNTAMLAATHRRLALFVDVLARG